MNESNQTRKAAAGQRYLAQLTFAGVMDPELLEHALQRRGKAALTAFLRWVCSNGIWKALMGPITVSELDTVAFDYPLRVGKADMAIFHVDGTVTIVNVQDGDQGVHSVVAGLGDVGLHAAQVDPAKALKGVRRALVWTQIQEPYGANPLVDRLCRDAGAIPVFLPALPGLIQAILRQQVQTTADLVGEFILAEKERASATPKC